MSALTAVATALKRPLRPVVQLVLRRFLRRSDYGWIWSIQARSLRNADLAVAGSTDQAELSRSGQATAARIRELTLTAPTDVVLEIGCGTARVGVHFAPHCATWIGGDVSRIMLRHAQDRMRAHANARFVLLDGSSLAQIPSASIDVVYCTTVFMHIDEWDRYAYIEEAHRVLKTGGRLYVDSLNLTGEMGWEVFRQLRNTPARSRPPHASRCSTAQELETYLRRAGFTQTEVIPEPLYVTAVGVKQIGVVPRQTDPSR